MFTENVRREMAITGGAAWAVDELPKRMVQIRQFLNTTRDRYLDISFRSSVTPKRNTHIAPGLD
jgi:hypothetical protein